MELANFGCASQDKRFHTENPCRNREEIKGIITRHRDIVTTYQDDFTGQPGIRHPQKYLTQESVALTDLVLADLIIKQEENESNTPFLNWLKLARSWREELQSPDFLITKSKVLIHYNHVLSALPVLINARPDLLARYAPEIDQVISPLPASALMAERIMIYEYALYEGLLERSQNRLFPAHPA